MDIDPQQARINAFAEHLKANHYGVEPANGALIVQCCGARSVITCRPYESDEGRLWFFSEPGLVPLAEADRVTDALVAVKGQFAPAASSGDSPRCCPA